MSEHPYAILARELVEMLDRNDLDGVGERVTDDVVWHYIGSTEPIRGRQALLRALGSSGGADWVIHAEIRDVTASDDHAVALLRTHATRQGRTLDSETAEVYRIRDGRVAEHRAYSDDTARILEFYARVE